MMRNMCSVLMWRYEGSNLRKSQEALNMSSVGLFSLIVHIEKSKPVCKDSIPLNLIWYFHGIIFLLRGSRQFDVEDNSHGLQTSRSESPESVT